MRAKFKIVTEKEGFKETYYTVKNYRYGISEEIREEYGINGKTVTSITLKRYKKFWSDEKGAEEFAKKSGGILVKTPYSAAGKYVERWVVEWYQTCEI